MISILVNCFPKCGMHATAKACELLGINVKKKDHLARRDEIPSSITHHIFVRRDPRNALISWLRFQGKPVTTGTFIAGLSEHSLGKSLPEAMGEFTHWLRDADFIVKFESLVESDAEMRVLASFLGVPYLDDAFPNLPNHTVTWTGRLSDYHEIWNNHIEEAWQKIGGPRLLAEWGYG